jgi:hypothetical protein
MSDQKVCPCGGIQVYDSTFDFWQCQSCFCVWSDGLGDPDYDDDMNDANEAIAERNIELINQWNPQ